MDSVRKIICILLITATVFLPMTACGRKQSETKITLCVTTTLGDEDVYPVYSSLLLSFTGSHSNVIIKDTTVRQSEAYKLDLSSASTFSGQSCPDVLYAPVQSVEDTADQFVSLREICADYPEYTENISKAALSSVDGSAGKCCLPVMGECFLLMENGTLADTLYKDLSPLDAPEKLVEAGAAAAKNGALLIANAPDECGSLLEQLALSFGGSQASELGARREPEALDGAWKSAFDVYERLCKNGGIDNDPELHIEESFKLFESLQSVMLLCSSKDLVRFPATTGYRMITLSHTTDERKTEYILPGGFSSGFFITKKAYSDPDRRQAAIDFVKHMTSAEAGVLYSTLGFISSNTECAELIDKPVSATVQMMADEADGFSKSVMSRNTVFYDDLSKRASECANGFLSPAGAAQLLKTPGAKLSDLREPVDEPDSRVTFSSPSDAEPNGTSDEETTQQPSLP